MLKQMTQKCLIIAEAGVNHNGSITLARQMVDAAAKSGADFIKFQTFRTDQLVTKDAPKADYQMRGENSFESQFEMLSRLEINEAGFRDLANYAAEKRIGFLSTPFDMDSARFLNTLNLDAFKVSSGDLTNTPFLRQLSKFGKPLIISTGMALLGEVEEALYVLKREGFPEEKITLLHCTTEYPAPTEEINLRAMLTIANAFPGLGYGYSDHSEGIEIAIAAVALGAQIIEKHFTLDRQMSGPDHAASLEPTELAKMILAIRNVSAAMGDGWKRPSSSEIKNRMVARKSIVASSQIRSGEILTENNITVLRPGSGISPTRWDDIIGQKAGRDYLPGDLI